MCEMKLKKVLIVGLVALCFNLASIFMIGHQEFFSLSKYG